jgi:hypothetical protein
MRLTVLATLLSITSACSGSAEAPAAAPSAVPVHPETPSSPSAPAVAPGLPKAAAGAEAAGGLVWEGKAPLVKRAPKTSMRAAEYGLEGEPQAELGVFYFGPDQGGSVDANLTRWLGQFSQPDGSDTAAKAVRDQVAFGGVPVTTIEATGTFSGGMAMPGAPAPGPIADAMLLGAIASGPKGPVFFKLTGPRAAIEKSREGFRNLLESLRVDPALSP